MKFTPASSARWTMRTHSSWSGLPPLPSIIAPRQCSLTLTPVLPSVCIFMACPPSSAARAEPTPRGLPVELGRRRELAGDDGVEALAQHLLGHVGRRDVEAPAADGVEHEARDLGGRQAPLRREVTQRLLDEVVVWGLHLTGRLVGSVARRVRD